MGSMNLTWLMAHIQTGTMRVERGYGASSAMAAKWELGWCSEASAEGRGGDRCPQLSESLLEVQ